MTEEEEEEAHGNFLNHKCDMMRPAIEAGPLLLENGAINSPARCIKTFIGFAAKIFVSI
jgi:hypothetical protein